VLAYRSHLSLSIIITINVSLWFTGERVFFLEKRLASKNRPYDGPRL